MIDFEVRVCVCVCMNSDERDSAMAEPSDKKTCVCLHVFCACLLVFKSFLCMSSSLMPLRLT